MVRLTMTATTARKPGRGDAIKICGQNACRALLERRPEDAERVYLTQDLLKPFGDVLKVLAKARRPYKLVAPSELEAITESKHHEGICVVARPRRVPSLDELVRAPGPRYLVALAEVENPHNLGAVLRLCAHFGAAAVLIDDRGAGLSPAAFRTAQGGAEWVDVIAVGDLKKALVECRRAGFRLYASSSHKGRDLYDPPLAPRAVAVLGSEGKGIAPSILQQCDETLIIPGTGHVESLNVASAAGIILAELWRRSR